MPKERLSEIYLRIVPGKFHYLKFILEGYDNLAILSAHDNSSGIVVIRYPQVMARELFELLSGIAGTLSKVKTLKC
jgi:hypothetical protein